MLLRRENETHYDLQKRLKNNEKTRLWQNYMYKHDLEFRRKKLNMVKKYQRRMRDRDRNIQEIYKDKEISFTIHFD